MQTIRAILTLILAIAASASLAEEGMPPVPMLDQLVQSDEVVFEVVLGRVSLVGGGFGTRNTSSTGPDRSESLQIRFTPDETFLSYHLSTPTDSFLVDVSADKAVRLERRPTGKTSAPAITYTQKPGQDVRLQVSRDDRVETIEARSLWHLFLAAPSLCGEHLAPMLGALGPQWNLETTSQAIEAGLLRKDSAENLADRNRWTGLLHQLNDDAFARREAADRELRAAGSAAIGFLRRLDFAALAPEQQYRVRRMLESNAGESGHDTVEETTAWLFGDAYAWLLLADRPDLATRRTAAARLADILGEPIEFDPQAAPELRSRQLDALRQRLR